MGRGRTKGKKLSVTNQDDAGGGEEEKIPAQKRRGRPQKSLKDEIDEEEAQIIEDEDSEDTSGKEMKNKTATATTQDGKKRKRNAQVKEKATDSVKEENGNGNRSSTEESNKSNGFRQNGNRRKNKPRRAAEAVVECN